MLLNADRVNLNKEVIQLQEDGEIANTTRFMAGCHNGICGQVTRSGNEQRGLLSIGDIRPERIGAFTQRTVRTWGWSVRRVLEAIDNGVNQQTLVVQVGNRSSRFPSTRATTHGRST